MKGSEKARRLEFGRTRRGQLLGNVVAYGQQPKDHERSEVGRVGRYLKKQASQAGVMRVGSGQGWILLREVFISMAARILFPDCHYTPNDSGRQVSSPQSRMRRPTSP